jgi:hypothetical protein
LGFLVFTGIYYYIILAGKAGYWPQISNITFLLKWN